MKGAIKIAKYFEAKYSKYFEESLSTLSIVAFFFFNFY